jgi:type IV secretion system protein VirB10
MKDTKKQEIIEEDDEIDFEEDDSDNDGAIDVGGPDVASGKGSKIALIAVSALLIGFVLYFLFFNSNENSGSGKNLELVTTEPDFTSENPAGANNSEDFGSMFNEDNEDVILKNPNIPAVPDLPEIFSNEPEDSVLPEFLELPEDKKDQNNNDGFDVRPPENSLKNLLPPDLANNNANSNPQKLPTLDNTFESGQKGNSRPESIIVVTGDAGPTNSVGYERNIINLNKDPISLLEESKPQVNSSYIKNRSTMLIQGKIMNAILETAINSEFPGQVRGIISRDVYAESGNNILIPRGSRMFGSYSSSVLRGQARIQINWTRLIRPDGVDASIAFVASDQFGRAGIEGDVDNKYGSIITNSILTSILAVGGAIAAEKLSGNEQVTTTNNAVEGTSTTTGTASSEAIIGVSKAIIDTIGTVIGNTMNTAPIIRVPQGTKVTIVVNQDMSLPEFKSY